MQRRQTADRNTTRPRLGNRRGSAALECALGMAVMVGAWALGFDIYQKADRQGTLMHTAAVFADYASRDEVVQAADLTALANFLHGKQFALSEATFIATAISKAKDEDPEALWTRTVAIDPDSSDTSDQLQCSRINGADADGNATLSLPSVFSMADDEIVIAAEVCIGSDEAYLYAHHLLPTRASTAPTLEEPQDDDEDDDASA